MFYFFFFAAASTIGILVLSFVIATKERGFALNLIEVHGIFLFFVLRPDGPRYCLHNWNACAMVPDFNPSWFTPRS